MPCHLSSCDAMLKFQTSQRDCPVTPSFPGQFSWRSVSAMFPKVAVWRSVDTATNFIYLFFISVCSVPTFRQVTPFHQQKASAACAWNKAHKRAQKSLSINASSFVAVGSTQAFFMRALRFVLQGGSLLLSQRYFQGRVRSLCTVPLSSFDLEYVSFLQVVTPHAAK